MGFLRIKKRQTDACASPIEFCLGCRRCECRRLCPHPGCRSACLAGHTDYPDSHLCPQQHWWTTKS